MTRRLRAVVRSAWDLYRDLLRHDVLVLAAAVAYTAILSFFPLLIGLIALLGQLVDVAKAQRAIVQALTPYLPPGVVSLVWGTLDAAIRARGTTGAVAIVALFWTATAGASVLRHGLNRVLGAPKSRPFWRRKVVELMMVLVVGLLLSLSIITSAAAEIVERVPTLVTLAETLRQSRLAVAAAAVGPWLLSAGAFIFIYRFLPNVQLGWRSLLAGSVTGAALFETIKHAFFWYLRTLSNYPLIYSYLAGVVVFMIWVYLVAVILLIGAEVAARVHRGSRPAPLPAGGS